VETLLKSIDSFSAEHANRAFFRALNPDMAEDIMADGAVKMDDPLHLTTSLDHAQNYIPHHPVVEFRIKPEAKVLDMRRFPKSEQGTWDATLPDDEDAELPLGRAGLVADELIDAFFHEFEDILEVHDHSILTPVRVIPPLLSN
jgi:hypothetical protein